MSTKKKIAIIILIVIALSAIFLISNNNHSYTIDNATLDLTVNKDGSVHVIETYDYSFKGEFNGVYRNIPLKDGENIENVQVLAEGAYPEIHEESDVKNGKGYKVYLYSDPEHTQKIKDCDVKVSIRYDFYGTVMLYDDIGGLQFKLWGDSWDVGVGNIKATIHLPGDTNNSYSINPEKYTESSSINGDKITINSKAIPQGEIYELLALMPADDFDSDAPYAKHNDGNGKEQTIKNLNDSLESLNFWSGIFTLYQLLTCLIPISLIITYLLFGREPKVDYDGVYERELPSDDPPEVINAIFAQHYIGKPDMKGFEASILNLIDRKIIDITTKKDGETSTNDLLLTFNNDKKEELSTAEKILFDALSGFATDNVLNLATLNKKLSFESNAKWFMNKYETWQKTVDTENKEKQKQYFDERGTNIGMTIEIGAIILGVILFFVAGLMTTKSMRTGGMQMAVIIGVIGLVALFLPQDYIARWTPEGRVLYLKWKNFKKFLKDNSLIAEHPPESIAIWRKYLIYGAALGVADNVYKAMKIHEPNINPHDDGLFLYHSYGGYAMMHAAIRTGEVSANPSSSDSGGFGGFGGGSGGGGGGAF